MRPMVVVLSATALFAASSQPIRADPVSVDQVSALSASPADAPAASAQSPSMLVGISGQLVALEVFLSTWATAGPAEARATGNMVATGDASSTLASHTISPFAAPGLGYAPVYFDLASAQLQVISGRLLAFVEGNPGLARGDAPRPAAQTDTSSFLPPAALAGPAGSGSGVGGVGTVVFAQPAPVPEPTTIALVGSGLLLGAMGRRRQRKQANKK